MKLFPMIFLGLFAALPLFAQKPSAVLIPYPGEGLSADAGIAKKKPVFIFYFADLKPSFTSPLADRVQAILTALTPTDDSLAAEDKSFLARVRELIRVDLELPRRIADNEVAALKRELCHTQGRFPANAVFFQNSANPQILYENKFDIQSAYDVCTAKGSLDGTTRRTWKITNAGALLREPAWEDQLLTNPVILSKALDDVMTLFPPAEHRYYLFIEGRGNAENTLALQYAFDTAKLDGKKIRERLLEHKADFGANPATFTLKTEYAAAVQRWLAEGQPALSEYQGTTKRYLLERLAKLGGGDPRKGAFFSGLWLNVTGGPLELDPGLAKLVTEKDYSRLNLPAIGGIRHFGAEGFSGLLPFNKLADFFGAEMTLEERFTQLFDRGGKNK